MNFNFGGGGGSRFGLPSLGIGSLVFGSIFVVSGFFVSGINRPYEGGIETNGTVVSVDHSVSTDSDGDRDDQYTPTVRFTDEAGASHTVKSKVSSGSRPSIGDTKKVSYMADNPDGAMVVENIFHYFGIGMMVIGALFVGSGLIRLIMVIGLGTTGVAYLWKRYKNEPGINSPAPQTPPPGPHQGPQWDKVEEAVWESQAPRP